MPPEVNDEKAYRRRWWSWALYDVANSAFWLVIVAAVFPVFYQGLYVDRMAGDGPPPGPERLQALRTRGGSLLGYTAGAAMALVAVLGPILGALSDRTALKKKFLAGFAALGVAATALMTFIPPGGLALASVLYALGTIGVAGSMVFYDALLPSVARDKDLDRVSTLGFAVGYLGSVVLFVLNVLWIQNPAWFGLSGAAAAVRLSFLSVAVWWALFTIPLLRKIPEPPASAAEAPGGSLFLEGFRRLARTFRNLGNYRQLVLFLAAFWIYSDGIGTIIKMAAAFGNSLGVKTGDLMTALVVTQVVGVPCALAFGLLARRIGPKAGILLGLSTYAGICVFAAFMSRTWHFYALAAAVGLVQGGTQALSRSLFASMVPPTRTGEFFGFFSTVEKFAGILGPVLLGLFWHEGGDPRRGVVALVVFFLAGGLLLAFVNVAEGRRAAAEPASPAETAPPGAAKAGPA
jgi:UMF1 family MFS transporter